MTFSGSDQFVGRQDDIQLILESWDKALKGEPQALAILAPSGYGKTRLVAEAYARIIKRVDGANSYWPKNIEPGQYRGKINPDMSQKIVDSSKITDSLQMLWWGLHLNAPKSKTGLQDSCLSHALPKLAPHILAYESAIEKDAKVKAMAKTAAISGLSAAADIALNLISSGLYSIITSGVKTAGQAGYDIATSQGSEELTLGEHVAERDTLASRIVTVMRAITAEPPKGLKSLPICLVIDEAQWNDGDEGLKHFVAELLKAAGAEKWRLLVIVMSWPAEWRQQSIRPETDKKVAPTVPSIWHAPELNGIKGVNFQSINLVKLKEMDVLLNRELPGLLPAQAEIFLSRADGNPLFLKNLIGQAKDAPVFFKNKDFTGTLTPKGEIFFKTVTYETLIENRLKAAPYNIRSVVGVGSTIGLQFSKPLAAEMAAKLSIKQPLKALEAAEVSHGYLTDIARQVYEFRQSRYQEVAQSLFYKTEDENEVNDLREEVQKDLLAKALTGEIEVASVPLEALSPPKNGDITTVCNWVWTLARLIHKVRRTKDDTQLTNIISLYITDFKDWFNPFPFEQAPSNSLVKTTLKNLEFLILGIESLPDPRPASQFKHSVAKRFLQDGWMNHTQKSDEWAEICCSIADILKNCISIGGTFHNESTNYAHGALHFANKASGLQSGSRGRIIAADVMSLIVDVNSIQGDWEATRVSFENYIKAINYTSPASLSEECCTILRGTSINFSAMYDYYHSVLRDKDKAENCLDQAFELANMALNKCDCDGAWGAINEAQRKRLKAITSPEDEPRMLKIYAENLKTLNNFKVGSNEVRRLSSLGTLEKTLGHYYSKPTVSNLEKAGIHYQNALTALESAHKIFPSEFIKTNLATTKLSIGRLYYLSGDQGKWLEYTQEPIEFIQTSFFKSKRYIPTFQLWLDNTVRVAISVGQTDMAIDIIKSSLVLYNNHHQEFISQMYVFRSVMMYYWLGVIAVKQFLAAKGRQPNEAEAEVAFEAVSHRFDPYIKWLDDLDEEFDFEQEEFTEYVLTGALPLKLRN